MKNESADDTAGNDFITTLKARNKRLAFLKHDACHDNFENTMALRDSPQF